MPGTEGIGRRLCIPILYTKGTHYEVGFDVGRNFASIIDSFINKSDILNIQYIPAYETPIGKKAYDDTLACVLKNFPQYVQELEGVSDGSKVPFYKLFLLHMDNITTNVCGRSGNTAPVGCSSIILNHRDNVVLGHTEDALPETLNHFYFVSAHIISDKPQGKWGVREERFTSLCYAGHLPGYTMNYNHHGLVFSINTLSAVTLRAGKTPRHFLTRALLAAENFTQAECILRDTGCGAGDGCSVNITFLNERDDAGRIIFRNIEMAPARDNEYESALDVLNVLEGEHVIHCNTYLRLPIQQVTGFMSNNSSARLTTLKQYSSPSDKEDVIKMLSDQSGSEHRVFQDFGNDDAVKTIAMGIFDCTEKTWSIYADNPEVCEPLVVLPLVLKNN